MPTLEEMIKETREAMGDTDDPAKFAEVFNAIVEKYKVASEKGGQPEADADKAAASAAESKSLGAPEEGDTKAKHGAEGNETREAASPVPDPVEAASPVPDPVEAAPPEGEGQAMDTQIVSWFGAWAQALGMEPAELLAVAEEKADELTAVVQGASPDGTEADGASAMSSEVEAEAKLSAREASSLRKQLSDRDARITELESTLNERDQRLGEAEVEGLIRAGTFLETDREWLQEMRAEAPKAFAKRVAAAQQAPAVPAGTSYQPKPAASETDPDSDKGADIPDDLRVEMTKAVRASGRHKRGSDQEKAEVVRLCRKTIEQREARENPSAQS